MDDVHPCGKPVKRMRWRGLFWAVVNVCEVVAIVAAAIAVACLAVSYLGVVTGMGAMWWLQ